jgi:hypothetical protein
MKKLWIDTRLNNEEMDFLWKCISEENKEKWNNGLAGNISKSELIQDKDNWFHENVLQDPTEKLFYQNWDAYYRYHILKEDPLPKFKLNSFWVNYMKQHEFNPLHYHEGLFSFVVFMKIPTHWKEQHALPFVAHSNSSVASDFAFVWSEKGHSDRILRENFPLSSEDEGRMLFFPAFLQHEVFPFYGTEEERVTISGNIVLEDLNKSNKPKMQKVIYEQKEEMLKMMKIGVQQVEKELKQMKKERENVG